MTLHSTVAPREPAPAGRGEFPEWDDTEAYLDDPYEAEEDMAPSNEMTPSLASIAALTAMYNSSSSGSVAPTSVGSFKTEFTRGGSMHDGQRKDSGDDERETWDENPPYFDEKEVMMDDDYSGFFKSKPGGTYGDPNDMVLPVSSDLNAKADIEGAVESGAYKSAHSRQHSVADGGSDSTTIVSLKRIGDALRRINLTLIIIGTINILIQLKLNQSRLFR